MDGETPPHTPRGLESIVIVAYCSEKILHTIPLTLH